MVPRRVSVILFEYHYSVLVVFVFMIIFCISFYKAIKRRKRRWVVMTFIAGIALALFIMTNIIIQASPLLDSQDFSIIQ